MLFFPLKGLKKSAKNACLDAFPTFCVHLCDSEIQHHHLIWRYFLVKRNIKLHKMEVANAIFHYELEHFWYHFVSIMERRGIVTCHI